MWQCGALPPQPWSVAHWHLPDVQVSPAGHSELVVQVPQKPPWHPGVLPGQSVAVRQCTHLLVLMSHFSPEILPVQSASPTQSTHLGSWPETVRQTWSWQLKAPQLRPVLPVLPDVPLPATQAPALQLSFARQSPLTAQRPQLPLTQAWPAPQSATVRHCTQMPVQKRVLPVQSASLPQAAQPDGVHTVFGAVVQSELLLQATQRPVLAWQNGVPFAAVHMPGLPTQDVTQAPCAKLVVSHVLPDPQSALVEQPQKPVEPQTGASPPQFALALQWHLLSLPHDRPIGQLALVSQVPQALESHPGES